MQHVYDHDDEAYTQQAAPSPADNDEELDEEQGVRGGAVGLGGGGGCGEVHRTLP